MTTRSSSYSTGVFHSFWSTMMGPWAVDSWNPTCEWYLPACQLVATRLQGSRKSWKDVPISAVVALLELELVVVEVSRGNGPSRNLGGTVAEGREELGESVPVNGGVFVALHVIIDSDPVVLALDKAEQRTGRST